MKVGSSRVSRQNLKDKALQSESAIGFLSMELYIPSGRRAIIHSIG